MELVPRQFWGSSVMAFDSFISHASHSSFFVCLDITREVMDFIIVASTSRPSLYIMIKDPN